MSLIPLIRSSASKRYTLLAASISFNRKIISFCSYYIKKGLVYVTITALFNYQPSSYLEYTKLNTCFAYNIRLVFINKCTPFIYLIIF